MADREAIVFEGEGRGGIEVGVYEREGGGLAVMVVAKAVRPCDACWEERKGKEKKESNGVAFFLCVSGGAKKLSLYSSAHML